MNVIYITQRVILTLSEAKGKDLTIHVPRSFAVFAAQDDVIAAARSW
jgi:hypothetical protein